MPIKAFGGKKTLVNTHLSSIFSTKIVPHQKRGKNSWLSRKTTESHYMPITANETIAKLNDKNKIITITKSKGQEFNQGFPNKMSIVESSKVRQKAA